MPLFRPSLDTTHSNETTLSCCRSPSCLTFRNLGLRRTHPTSWGQSSKHHCFHQHLRVFVHSRSSRPLSLGPRRNTKKPKLGRPFHDPLPCHAFAFPSTSRLVANTPSTPGRRAPTMAAYSNAPIMYSSVQPSTDLSGLARRGDRGGGQRSAFASAVSGSWKDEDGWDGACGLVLDLYRP